MAARHSHTLRPLLSPPPPSPRSPSSPSLVEISPRENTTLSAPCQLIWDFLPVFTPPQQHWIGSDDDDDDDGGRGSLREFSPGLPLRTFSYFTKHDSNVAAAA